jgi:alkylhydroperoxidase family enzyme
MKRLSRKTLTRTELWLFRRMAAHQDIVEQVIAASTDADPPSRAKVMRAIAEAEGRAAAQKCVCPECGATHRKKASDEAVEEPQA